MRDAMGWLTVDLRRSQQPTVYDEEGTKIGSHYDPGLLSCSQQAAVSAVGIQGWDLTADTYAVVQIDLGGADGAITLYRSKISSLLEGDDLKNTSQVVPPNFDRLQPTKNDRWPLLTFTFASSVTNNPLSVLPQGLPRQVTYQLGSFNMASSNLHKVDKIHQRIHQIAEKFRRLQDYLSTHRTSKPTQNTALTPSNTLPSLPPGPTESPAKLTARIPIVSPIKRVPSTVLITKTMDPETSDSRQPDSRKKSVSFSEHVSLVEYEVACHEKKLAAAPDMPAVDVASDNNHASRISSDTNGQRAIPTSNLIPSHTTIELNDTEGKEKEHIVLGGVSNRYTYEPSTSHQGLRAILAHPHSHYTIHKAHHVRSSPPRETLRERELRESREEAATFKEAIARQKAADARKKRFPQALRAPWRKASPVPPTQVFPRQVEEDLNESGGGPQISKKQVDEKMWNSREALGECQFHAEMRSLAPGRSNFRDRLSKAPTTDTASDGTPPSTAPAGMFRKERNTRPGRDSYGRPVPSPVEIFRDLDYLQSSHKAPRPVGAKQSMLTRRQNPKLATI
ncbi:hypothetical protein MKZ38_000505 [Zalerion maritima]|uniref:Uncharacterized protein n=1 Tax=Zalerion maritima TaxID=339359 RepID=A0AAD5RT36_9PEZI|nr:hypothetical protein MKZ38_000505 [Zalerion maritima]